MVDWFHESTAGSALLQDALWQAKVPRQHYKRPVSRLTLPPETGPIYSNLFFAKDEEELRHPARSTQHTSQYFPNFRPFSLNTPTTLNPNRRCSASVAAFGNTYTPTKR